MQLFLAFAILWGIVSPMQRRFRAQELGALAVREVAHVPSLPRQAHRSGPPFATYWITGYDLTGSTATGIAAGFGVVAVDPSVIPLHAWVEIQGLGVFRAEDTGGAIIGRHLDVWEPTAAQCYAITGYRQARWSVQRSDLGS